MDSVSWGFAERFFKEMVMYAVYFVSGSFCYEDVSRGKDPREWVARMTDNQGAFVENVMQDPENEELAKFAVRRLNEILPLKEGDFWAAATEFREENSIASSENSYGGSVRDVEERWWEGLPVEDVENECGPLDHGYPE